MANTGLLLLFFAGVILVIVNEMVKDRVPEVEYRYLPRDLDTYLREEPLASATFEKIFKGDETQRFPTNKTLTDELKNEATWSKYYEMRRKKRLPTAEDMKDIREWYKRVSDEYRKRGPKPKPKGKPVKPVKP
jgi:hypothetical protein